MANEDKPDWKKTDSELREGKFRPRTWFNDGHPILKGDLKAAILKADLETFKEKDE